MANIVDFWRHRRKTDRGLDEAFEGALRPHIPALYRMAWRWCGNPEEAEELLQAMICKLYPQREQLLDIDKLRPWLARILYRQFVDQHRRRQLEPDSLDQFDDPEAAIAAEYHEQVEIPDAVFESELLQKQLSSALNVLPEAQRVLIIMHDVEGYTLDEISVVLDTPVGTLKSRLHRCREKLRNLLNPDGT